MIYSGTNRLLKILHNNIKFVIYSPRYRNSSAGIRVLYRLRDLLITDGYEAVCTREKVCVDEYTIVIYPEITKGNPLNAKKVVRYILNVPGKIGHGDGIYDKNDLLFAFSTNLSKYSNGNILTINVVEDYFKYEDEEKSYNLFYVGKGRNLYHPITHGATEITRFWPETREKLAELLKHCKILFTYDNYSCLTFEAKRCGCTVMFIDANNTVSEIDKDFEEFGNEKEQYLAFISQCTKLIYLK